MGATTNAGTSAFTIILRTILFLAIAATVLQLLGSGLECKGEVGTCDALAFRATGFLVSETLAVLLLALGFLTGALVFLGGLKGLEKIIYTNFEFLVLNISVSVGLVEGLVISQRRDDLRLLE